MDLHKLFTCTFSRSLLISIPFLLSSCDSANQTAEYDLDDRIEITHTEKKHTHRKADNAFIFGFDLRASPQEDARQYLPFLKYLETETGYKFILHFTPENRSIIDELGKNHVQFAAIGADTFLKANEKYGVIPVARGVNLQGKAEYQSAFVVSPGSKIKILEDIKGKRLAFGSRSSTQGHLIPRIVLTKNNIDLKIFSRVSYTGSHRNCADSVISNKSDVCTMQDTMAKRMVKQGLLRIIHTSNYYPSSGIAANRDVPVEVINKVRQALLNFRPAGKDKEGLYHWNRTEMPLGFSIAKIDDYNELRRWSIQLGFMEETKESGK